MGGNRAFDFGASETGRLMASLDWDANPLGPPEAWPEALRTALGIMLDAAYPMFVAWGPELVFVYNDGYRPVMGDKHPTSMARPFAETWAEVWSDVEPIARRALAGEATYWEDLEFRLERSGFAEQTFFTFSYFPVRDGRGAIDGIMCAATETTTRVIGERRMATLNALAARSGRATTAAEACALAVEALAGNPDDIPGATLYLPPQDGGDPTRAAGTGDDGAPAVLDAAGIGELHGRGCTVLPLGPARGDGAAGLLAVRSLPCGRSTDEHQRFLRLVAEQTGSLVAAAEAYAAEHRRADALAELDRAKTEFFSDVSHEFRTPLSLLLAPVADALAEVETADPALQRERLEIAERNGQRLLRLVNALLDHSRLEAGRAEPDLAAVDLPRLTAELASAFAGAMDAAGLRLELDCPPLRGPVLVDRGMWEKIVLNLLSNAFKFTFDGGVHVALRERDGLLELSVRDTGVGIPADDLPRLFERFHRVRGGRARTHEGTGIGLALVRELARAHGGDATVASTPGEGTEVRVSIAAADAVEPAAPAAASAAAGAVAREALRWLPSERAAAPAPHMSGARARALGREGARILLADDNADMRDYLARLLGERWSVETHDDGAAALTAALAGPPDLILSDVMMPVLDGFGLIAALRADPRTRGVPVVLLSARAGEEAVLEGLRAGADDYLVKPFSAQELLTRVGAHLELAAARAELAEQGERTRMASLVAALQDGVASLRADGAVVSANARLAHMAGRPVAALAGAPLPVAWTGPGAGDWEALIGGLETSERVEVDGTLATGGEPGLPVLLTLSPLVSDDGAVAVATVKDVRERKAAERAKDEFVSLASHELLTPLSSVLGFLDLAVEGSTDPDEQRRYLGIARRNAGRLERLTRDILDLSRGDSGRLMLALEPLDLRAVIVEAVGGARVAAEARGIALDTAVGDLPALRGDAGRLGQLLDNLLANALKFTPGGGRVQVSATTTPGEVVVEVSDTGLGIPDAELGRVFDRFYRTEAATRDAIPGSGLGLAVARMIAEGHGGRIEALTRAAGGTTMRVTLPTRPAPAPVVTV